jgi:hypothetical protein
MLLLESDTTKYEFCPPQLDLRCTEMDNTTGHIYIIIISQCISPKVNRVTIESGIIEDLLIFT